MQQQDRNALIALGVALAALIALAVTRGGKVGGQYRGLTASLTVS